MRLISTLAFWSLFWACAFTQDYIPGSFVALQNAFTEQPCPYDPQVMVWQPEGWSVYQTQNGRWDGPQDSTRCLSFTEATGGWRLDLGSINPSQPLFFRYKMGEMGESLPSNAVYANQVSFWTDATPIGTDTCVGGLCTGVLVIYSVPFDADSTVVREVRNTSGFYKDVTGCWTTENLESILLQEYIFMATFADADLTGKWFKPLYFLSARQDEFYEYAPVETFEFRPTHEQSEGQYWAYLYDVVQPDPWSLGYYIQQDGLGFPGWDHITYVEAFPPAGVAGVTDLTIYLDNQGSLLFQPYTAIRGALVDPSDTLRHRLTLDIPAPDNCQAFLVDVVVPDNTRLLLGDGAFTFGNKVSCFMFRDGGTLSVKSGAHFQYGASGIGQLGMVRNSHLDLQPNGTLLIDNIVTLVAFSGSHNEQAYVHLSQGSTLRFGPHATLRRSFGENMYLNVYMDGGALDDSELTTEEKQLIRRIYPTVTIPAGLEAAVAPNPASGVVTLLLPDNGQEAQHFSVMDMQGRILFSGRPQALAPGRYQLSPTAYMPAGLYKVRVQTTSGVAWADWVVVH